MKKRKVNLEETVVIIKPDGIQRGLIGEMIKRFENIGLQLVAIKMIWVDKAHVKKHYPSTRTEWLTFIGERALDTYKEYGRDPGEDLDTMEPLELGKKMAGWLIDYFVEGPVIAMIWRGENSIGSVRKLVGHTFGDKALPGTIRGDFTSERGYMAFVREQAGRNLIHASGNKDEAKFERKLWFKESEIHEY